jgi:hypothetical protein
MLLLSHKLCGFQERLAGLVVVMKEQFAAYSDLLENSTTHPNGVFELVNCSTTAFVHEFSNFNIFCRFAGAWLL